MRTLFTLNFAGAVLALYLLRDLATTYATEGWGLHPALAVAAGSLVTVIGWVSLRAAARGRL